MKRGARPSSSDLRRERSSRAPSSAPTLPPLQRSAPPPLKPRPGREPYRDEQARSVVPKGSEGLSLSEEARAFGRDEHEAQLLEQFFSWPPPPPRAADLTLDPFERAPLPRGTRRAIWASSLMLVLSVGLIGGYFAYHNYVMPAPAMLGDWSDTDLLALPTPLLADDIAEADPEPRRVYQASLQHDLSAITQVEPVAEDAPAAGKAPPDEGQAPPAEPTEAEADPGVAPAVAAAPAEAQPAKSEAPTQGQGNVAEPVPAAAATNFYDQLSLAQAQVARGELQQSLPTFERALELRAHSMDALLGKATALFGLKDYEAAKSSAQLALAIDPRSNEAFALIGGSLEWLGYRAEAEAIYERCIDESVDPTVCRERLAHLSAGK